MMDGYSTSTPSYVAISKDKERCLPPGTAVTSDEATTHKTGDADEASVKLVAFMEQ